ncbi:hypothetical protein QBC37DRAFT_432705 [Rhypophila decipiens]|uniref:Uncharacterized protein n=1 Tax=Rhypophila decipiens TaxID=261697 RepID=A0AAN7B1Z0_9PEZI|nr:hypothetical protein QBC37DRAFT_432705 [Rhypophila decipiens]
MVRLKVSLCTALCAAATSVVAGGIGGEERACDNFWITIEPGRADIDFYKNCKVIDGSGFFIAKNFTGPFELPGVESIPRFSAGYLLPKLAGLDRVDDGVTSVSMPDVKNITQAGFLIGYVDSVTKISFPKLEYIQGDVVIVDSWNLSKLSLPALETVNGGVILEGDFEEIDLPSLKSVDYLRIRASSKLDCPALGKQLGPQLNFTLEEDDINLGSGYEGFTCRGGYSEDNWFNSSDTAAGGAGSGGSGAGGNGSDGKNGARALRIEYGLGAVLLAMAAVFGL